MKCPICQAWSGVLETRARSYGMYRRYECANLHRFATQERVVNAKQDHDQAA